MADPQIDPGGFYEFDLSRGAVRSSGGGRVVVLTEDTVAALLAAALKLGDLTAVRKLGMQLGVHARRTMDREPGDCPPEVVLSHAATVMALFGWGELGLERWGDAVLATVTNAPVLDEQKLGLATLLGGLFSSLVGHDVACVPVGTTGRYLVVHPTIAEKVWEWAQRSTDVATLVSRLMPTEAK